MRISLLVIFLLLPSLVFAHPVDREREREPHLGLNDDAFFACFIEHWHCRRELEDLVTRYAVETGKQQARREDLGLSPALYDGDVLDYFQVVPAEPITERPGDIPNCKAHTAACVETTKIFQQRLDYLEYLNTLGARAVAERINKPAPICPARPPRR